MVEPVPFLDDVLGQGRAVGLLRSALSSNRVHHAWVFAGPRGVGKRTAAVAFAALLLDPTLEPDLMGNLALDPESRTRQLMAAGAHPDFQVVTKELASVSADAQVRAGKQMTIPKQVLVERLIEPAHLAGSDASKGARARKVFIVDDAELMGPPYGNNPAQNALLKTLEEPPAGCVIILVTSQEDRLLPTIRSRCQRVAFTRLSDEHMDAWKARAKLDLSGEAWAFVKRFAEGSPGMATTAVETGLAEWARIMEPRLDALVRGRFDADFGKAAHDLADGWAKERVKRLSKLEGVNPSKESANREAQELLVRLLGQRLRAHLRTAAAEGGDVVAAAQRIDLLARAEQQVGARVPMEFAMDVFGGTVAAG